MDGAYYAGLVGGTVAAVAIAVSAHSSPFYSFDPGNTTVKIFGAILGAALYGAAFGLVGGTIAGIVALMEDQDKVYDLSHASLKGKQYVLQTILKEQ